ncbi:MULTISPECIES: hypothetical protein [Psychrobacter]|uniref:hypothetical protein n=2 Tax=Moraxellaceae TaxID=468 RepID=UPI000ED0A8F0|nr:hypothetical protein [Psychrobacter sp.]HCT73402.1 hypothetical protein [Psychrobacter sp.]
MAKRNKSQKRALKETERYAKKSTKNKIQIFSSAPHSQQFKDNWVVEKDFTCVRLGLLRFTQIIAAFLIIFSIPVAGYLMHAVEEYAIFIVIAVFVTAILSAALLMNPSMIFRGVNWLRQGNIKLKGKQIELKIDNKIHYISVLNIRKFKCYKINNHRSKIEVLKIIIKMKDGSKFSLYQSTNFSRNIHILHSVGVMIESILPDHFEKIDKGAWLHRKETIHYTDMLTVIFITTFIGIVIYFKMYDFLFIVSMLVLIVIAPRFILFITSTQHSSDTYIYYINRT